MVALILLNKNNIYNHRITIDIHTVIAEILYFVCNTYIYISVICIVGCACVKEKHIKHISLRHEQYKLCQSVYYRY